MSIDGSIDDFAEGVRSFSETGVHDAESTADDSSGQNVVVTLVNVEDDIFASLQSIDGIVSAGGFTVISEAQLSNGSPDEEVSADETTVSLEPGVHGGGDGGNTVDLNTSISSHGGNRGHQTTSLLDGIRTETEDLTTPSWVTLAEMRRVDSEDANEAKSSNEEELVHFE